MATEIKDYPSLDIIGSGAQFSQEAEAAVLGGMLFDPKCIDKVAELIKTPDCFYRPQHQAIFSIIMRLYSVGKADDTVSVIDESVKAGVFSDSQMARTYLLGLVQNVKSVANIESHCNILIEKALIRKLVSVSEYAIKSASESAVSADNLLDDVEQKIFDIRQGRSLDGLTHISEVVVGTIDHLQAITGADAAENLGASSGFADLDTVITGLNKSDMIVIAARPGMGKTAFALNIAVNSCKRSHRDVVIFSLEMGKEQLASRILSAEALVNNTSLRNGQISPEDWDKLAEAADVISGLPIYVDDSAGITVSQMKAKLRRMRNLGLVVIDYIQLMQSPNKHSSRVTEVSEITRQIKLMAKDLNVPVIALSQLSRDSEKRKEAKRPMLSDLRESGSIEQDADIVMFLYRDAYYDTNSEDQTTATCIVAKNRHGELKDVELAWRGEYTLFTSINRFAKDD
ncbi:MAG: replicative DNA helicase [Ruminococcus sp.]|nr:replicative DNA helicase [Ruminococcus sp.]